VGQLEEALVQYRRSKDFGVDRAEIHIRNVSLSISEPILLYSCFPLDDLLGQCEATDRKAKFHKNRQTLSSSSCRTVIDITPILV
jgi:hypothetical protein